MFSIRDIFIIQKIIYPFEISRKMETYTTRHQLIMRTPPKKYLLLSLLFTGLSSISNPILMGRRKRKYKEYY